MSVCQAASARIRKGNADQVPTWHGYCKPLGMKQQTLSMAADQNADFGRYRRPTRRDQFLATMEQVVPWEALCSVVEPHYPKPGNGRPPVGSCACCGCTSCSTGST